MRNNTSNSNTYASALLAALLLPGLACGSGGGGANHTTPSNSNSGGTNSGTSTPVAAPSITTAPASVSTQPGQTATFSVTATGPAPLTYQWSRNGTAIPGATSASYTTPALSLVDNGASFTATVSDSGGSVTSTAAILTVAVSVAAPAGLTYATNPAAYTLGVPVARNPPSSTGGPVAAYAVAPALPAGLTLDPVTGILAGTPTALAAQAPYTVTATNPGGSTTATLQIAVKDLPPSISYSSGSYTFTAGLPIQALTPVNTGGAILSWAISPALPTGLTFQSGTGVIAGTPTSVSPATPYTVTATNSGGSTTVAPTLTVQAAVAPSISSQPASITVNAGATATFSVTASGTGPLTYQWNRNGSPISGATASAWTTPATTSADNGAQFTVTVTNAVGAVLTSATATLTVNSAPPPTITAQPLAQTLVTGQTATLSVTATGTGPLTYQWYRNGNAISGATASSCQTPALALTDSGASWTVGVSNSAASVLSSPAVLRVLAPVATPSHTLLIEPDQGLASIYALINGASQTIDITMYEFNGDSTMLNALLAAATRGVKVRVMLDTNSENKSNSAVFTALSNGGSNIQVHWANPIYTYTHQKTLTVDASTSAILTLNLVGADYPTTRDFGVLENDSNDIAAILTTFEADFNLQPITPPTGTDLVWSPTNARSSLLGIIQGATSSLLIEQEEMADSGLQNAIIAALGRGVQVTMVQENTGSYTTALNALKAAGAKIVVYTSTASTAYYIHAKAILADYGTSSAKLFLGSENISTNSLNNNRELGLIFNDAASMDGVSKAIQADYAGGKAF